MSLLTVVKWDGSRWAPVPLAAAIKTLPADLRRFGFLSELKPAHEHGAPPSTWGNKAVEEVALCMQFITKHCEPATDANTGSDALTRRINLAQRNATHPMKVEQGSVIAAAHLLGCRQPSAPQPRFNKPPVPTPAPLH